MRNFLKVLKWLGITAITLFVAAVVSLYIVSRDIPPTDVSGLMPPDPPQVDLEDNAFTYFSKADEMLSRPFETVILRDFLQDKSVDTNELRQVLEKYEELVQVLAEGTSKNICIVPEVNRAKCFDPYIDNWIDISQVLWARAKYERISDNLPAATATCVTLLKYGELLQRHADTAVYYLVSGGVCSKGLIEAMEISHDKGVTVKNLNDLLHAVSNLEPVNKKFSRMLKRDYRSLTANFLNDDLKDCGSGGSLSRISSNVLFQPNKLKAFYAIVYRDMTENVSRNFSRLEFLDYDRVIKISKDQNASPLMLYFPTLPALDSLLKLRESLFEGITIP